MRKYIYIFTCTLLVTMFFGSTVLAIQPSLKVQPLEYREFIDVGEKKMGFVDISNPTYSTQTISVKVQAFKQIDTQGNLAFYDDKQVSTGIKTDFDTFKLEPRQALRMVFQIDGTKLPRGNVFAAIFFTTLPSEKNTTSQQVSLGTILSLTNQTPSSQHVSVESFDVPFLQIGDAVQGAIKIKNTADPKKETGVYPKLRLRVDPIFSSDATFEGPLVFPGVSREKSFSLPTSRFGVYRLRVFDQSNRELSSQWFFAATGWVRPALIGVIFLLIALAIHKRNRILSSERVISKKGKKRTNVQG